MTLPVRSDASRPLRVLGLVAALVSLLSSRPHFTAQSSPDWLDAYREPAARLINEALSSHFAWERLAELGDTFGHRLSGSENLEAAIKWAVEEMKQDGLENVHTEPTMVPRWVRGQESAEIMEPSRQPLVMLGLGGSVGTPADGIVAETWVVCGFDELDATSERARGKIVVYNVPLTTYGETVQYRSDGASRAARHGARAVLLRSVGPPGLRTPHTGALRYAPTVPAIPAAAITVEDTRQLQRMQDRGTRVIVRLKMNPQISSTLARASGVSRYPRLTRVSSLDS